MDLRLLKKELRGKILDVRDSLSAEEIDAKSAAILEKFIALEEVRKAGTLFLFVNFRSEVRTVPMIDALLRLGKKVVVPFTDIPNKRLRLFYINGMDDLVSGSYGILEPDPAKGVEASSSDIDLAVVPGSGFDLTGGRMGYGGGFYDRLLPQLRQDVPRVALAFELQIVDQVPMGYYDRRVEIIVTEDRTIRISGERNG